MVKRSGSHSGLDLRRFGLKPVAHRPPFGPRYWIYSITAYLLPLVILVALPRDNSGLDELVWLVTLVPAFLLSLQYGLRGAFVALLVGTTLLLGVQLFLALTQSFGESRVTVPIYMAYGALAISVGWLSEQLHEHYEYALELQAAQKTEALGTMAAGVAHDFNNILTAMVANAELMADELDPEGKSDRRELMQLRDASRRGAGIVRNMLGFSRRSMLTLRPLDLVQVVEDHLSILRRIVPDTMELTLRVEDSLAPALADQDAAEHILTNLVMNARDALSGAGKVEIAIERARLDESDRERLGWGEPGEYVCLTVSDKGVGMDRVTVSRIFEPFFTGKEPGEGVGLGMAMVYGLVKQHHGFVEVQSELDVGTTVRVYFPLAAVPPRNEASVAADSFAPVGTATILLVEDEVSIRRATQRILERLGYSVLVAVDGEEALDIYNRHREDIDLILSDVVLPKRTGPEFYEEVRTGPGIPKVLFMSGYSGETLRNTGGLDPDLPFLQKPWSVHDLRTAVCNALGAPE